VSTAIFYYYDEKPGTWTIEASDASNILSPDSKQIVVKQAIVKYFVITGLKEKIGSGEKVGFKVEVRDLNKKLIRHYTGTIRFSSTDSHAQFSPQTYTFTPADQGVKEFMDILRVVCPGKHCITISDGTPGVVTEGGKYEVIQKKLSRIVSGTILDNGNVILEIPPDAIDGEVVISIIPKPTPPGLNVVDGTTYEFGPHGFVFKKGVRLTFKYDDSDQDGKVDGTNIHEGNIGIFYYDGWDWLWVSSTKVDGAKNTVSATIDHFSIYALGEGGPDFAEDLVEDLILTHNPCSPKGDGYATQFQFRTSKELVEVTLKIYDTLGDLVRIVADGEKHWGPDIVIPWDGRDEAGNIVKNGIYIYQIHVKGGGEKKTITKAIGVVK
jgi:hypothetical protein